MSVSIQKKGENVVAEPNVVPLCDVLLVLLIIFMVVTPLVQQVADVRLPTAVNTVNMPENPDVVLYIKNDGSMLLNADKVTIDDIASKIEEEFLTVQEKKLFLKSDGELEYGKLVDIYEKIREAGIENIAIITQKKTEKG